MQLFCSSHLVFIISYPFYQSGHARGSQLRDTGEAIRKTLLAYFPQRYPAGDTLRKTLVAYFPQRNAELTRSVTQIFSSTRREICGTLRNQSALRCGKCATENKGKPSKIILIALAHKLLRQAWGVIKNNTPFDNQFEIISPDA